MSEHKFNIDLNLLKNNSDLFFNNFTYHDLFLELTKWGNSISKQDQVIIIEASDPYIYFAQVLACLAQKKIPFLVPSKDNAFIKNQIKEKISFSTFSQDKNNFEFESKFKSEQEIYFLSSGTTSNPKIIVHELNSLLENVSLFSNYFNSTKHECYYLNLPINHIGGFMVVLRAFCNQASITTELRPKIDYISLVPTQIQKAITESTSLLATLKETKALLIGGAILSDQLKIQLDELKIKYYETYGMTETASFVALNNELLGDNKVFLDENNIIHIHSKSLFKTLIPASHNDHFVYKDGVKYYQTSDIGHIQNDLIYFEKRIDQIINTGGEKVNLTQLTNKISKSAHLNDFIITSVPDYKWGEKIILFTDELISNDKLKDNLIYYEVPKLILPKKLLPAGMKIAKSHLELAYLNSIFSHEFINNNSSETILVLHGFMECIEDWKFLSKLNTNYNWLFLNIPGHGHSTLNNFENWQAVVFNLNRFIHFFPNVKTIIGYSLGGRIAIEVNKLTPMNKLILISAGVGAIDQNEKDIRKSADEILMKDVNTNEEYKSFLNQWYKNKIFGNYNQIPKYEENIQFKINNNNLDEIKNAIIFYSPGLFPLREFQLNSLKLANELFYIYGELDLKYKEQIELLSNIPRIKIHQIDNSFHNLHKTHEDELSKTLKNIL